MIAVLGALWALGLRLRRPDVYASIGLGAKSATATALDDTPRAGADDPPDRSDFDWTEERP